MASNVKASIVLFVSLNLFLLVSSHNVDYNSNGFSSATNSENPVVINPENVVPNGNNPQGQSGNVVPNGNNPQDQSGNVIPNNPQGQSGNVVPNGNNPQGQSGTTNSGNPVVIRPGNVFPNGNNPQSQSRNGVSNGNDTQGQSGTCNPLNLGVCLNLLGLVKVDLGNVPTEPCCSVIQGLLDLEAAVCLCTAVRANVLGINIDLPISLNLVLNNCGKQPATEYICAP